MADNETTAKFKVDISELKKNFQEASRQIRLANAEFNAATSGMDSWGKSADGISAKLKQLNSTLNAQKTQLSSLEDQYALTVKEQGETSKGAQELLIKINNQKAAIGKTEKEIRNYNTKLEELQSEAEAATDSTDEQRTAFEKLKDTIKTQESELKNLKDKYANVLLEQGKNSTEAKNLANQIDQLSSELSENKKTLNDAENAADELGNSIEDLNDDTKKSSDGFTVMKGALANLVAKGLSFAIDAVKDLGSDVLEVGKNFESSMSNVSALSGATGEDLEMLEDTARKYGATTQFSASEAADALGYMALAGWDANQSADALGGVLDLAAASGMGLAESSDMVTDYLSAFGLEAKDSAKFADILAYAQANSNTTAQGLGEAYKNCAANMNAAGQDVETTTSLLGMLANQGLKGSEAGTALTAVMRDMTAKMKDGKIAIGDTQVEVMDANGNYRDMTDILKDVDAATQGMGDAQKASALQTTFTAHSIKGMNLILNAGVDNAADFEEELRNCSGSAGEMAEVMNNNLEGDLKSMNSAYEEFGLTLYENVNSPLRDVVQNITNEVLPAFTNMANGVDGSSAEVGNAVGGLVSNIITQITSMLPQFAQVAVSLVTSIISGLLDSLPEIIGAVVQMITTLLNSLGTMLPDIVNKIIEIIPEVVDALVDAIPTLIDAAIQFLMAIVQAIPKIIPKLIAALPKVIDSITNGLIKAIPALINGSVQLLMAIVDAIPQIIPPLIGAIPTIVTSIVNLLIKSLPVLLNGTVQLFMAMIDAIPIIINALVPEIPNIISTIVNVLLENIPVLLQAAVTLFMAMINAIPQIIAKLIEALPQIISTIVETLITPVEELFSAMWDGISEVWGAVATWFDENVIQPLVRFFQGLWNKIKEVFANVVNFFKDKFKEAWDKIKEVFAKVGEFFSGIWNNIKNAFSAVGNWFKETFQTAWKNIKGVFEPVGKFFSGIWDNIKNAFGKVSSWFKDTFSEAWQKVKDVFSTGGKIFDGIKDGILNGLKAVINRLIRGINKIIKVPFDGLNAALRAIKGVEIVGVKPFDWISEISVPQIPELAKGGVLRKGQVGLLEGDGAEAVVPLEKNTTWLDEIAKRLSRDINLQNNSVPQTINNNTTNNFNQNNYSPKSLSRLEIYRQSKNLLSAKGV